MSDEPKPIPPDRNIMFGWATELPEGRKVGTYKTNDGAVCLYFHKMDGAMRVRTELTLSPEAAQALVNCLSLIGYTISKPLIVTFGIPDTELRPENRHDAGTTWCPVGQNEGPTGGAQ